MATSRTEADNELSRDEHSQTKRIRLDLLSKMLHQKYLEMSSMCHQEQPEALYPPLDFTVSNYHQLQASSGHMYSPSLYTHPGGYHLKVVVWPEGVLSGCGQCVSLWVVSAEGDEDVHYEELKFPAKFTVTLELLNQHRDQDHIKTDIKCEMPWETAIVGYNDTFIPHSDLEWNADRQTQYLKDNCLKFRITKITDDS